MGRSPPRSIATDAHSCLPAISSSFQGLRCFPKTCCLPARLLLFKLSHIYPWMSPHCFQGLGQGVSFGNLLFHPHWGRPPAPWAQHPTCTPVPASPSPRPRVQPKPGTGTRGMSSQEMQELAVLAPGVGCWLSGAGQLPKVAARRRPPSGTHMSKGMGLERDRDAILWGLPSRQRLGRQCLALGPSRL